jgi:ATP-dependent protease ClpP protease subunit
MRQWFTMKKDDEEEGDKTTSAEILIYDAIGKSFWDDQSVSAKGFIDALAALGDVKEIRLRINSPGGDVFDGVAIYNAIKNHAAKVTAHIDGLAASAASFVAMAASHIIMPSNAFMLIHNASGFVMGTGDEMREVAADLDRIDKAMTATYAARSGMTAAKVRALMKEDRLMEASEAKELGFADETSPPVKMAASYSLRLLPTAAATRLRAATGADQSEPSQPHSDPVPDRPGDTPTVTPASSIVDLDAAKQQGIAEHKKYVTRVTELCTLANAHDQIARYVRASTAIEQVRTELLDRASEAARLVQSQHKMATQATAAMWGKVTDKLNARVKQTERS